MRATPTFIPAAGPLLCPRPPLTSPTTTTSTTSHTSPIVRMPSGDSMRRLRLPSSLPSALDRLAHFANELAQQKKRVVFFLDYDGTLSPIVEDPDTAYIPEQTREALSIVASRFTTAIVSGRSKEKVRGMVNLEQLIYAGSHGFDIEGPDGTISHQVASDCLPNLKKVRDQLAKLVPLFPGSIVEDNLLSISFHYRQVDPSLIPEVQRMVDDVANRNGLVRTKGKMVYEVRPLFDWHKGKAVEYLLEALELSGEGVLPIYIGDDVTDEDAFKVLQGKGISVIVADSSLSRDTHADMRLNDPLEVQKFLMHFANDDALAPRHADLLLTSDVSVSSE